MDKLEYQWASFGDLDNHLLYEILRLRQEVFVVEQNCVYQDADGLDQDSYHFLVRAAQEQEVAGYLRVIPPGEKENGPQVGRVLILEKYRKKGLARRLMLEALKRVQAIYPNQPVTVSAQCYLQKFYESLGFYTESEPYDEDGIPHVRMVRTEGDVPKKSEKIAVSSKCLRPDQLTDFARRSCTEEERQQYLDHIGTCQECYQKYTAMMMFNLKEQSETERKGVIYLFNYPVNLKALSIALLFVGAGLGLLFLL